jgi:hypothetical protein
MRARLGLAALVLPGLVAWPLSAWAADLSGVVRDADTGLPLAGARVSVVNTGAQARTDASGAYALTGLAPGTRIVKVEKPGYLPLVRRGVPLRDERSVRLTVALRRGVVAAPVQTVSGDRPSRLAQIETSHTSITADEVKKSAGARNDPILALSNTAGVHLGSITGDPAIRGGSPDDNLYFLDNFQIGSPYHFGGIVSVFNANTISKVDLYAGAMPARYGNVDSAVIDVQTRPPKTDAVHGVLDGNLLYSEGLLEGPLWPTWGFSLSGRRSYFDLVAAKFFPIFTVFPVFSDSMVRAEGGLPGGGHLDALSLRSSDALSLVLPGGVIGKGSGTLSYAQGYTSSGMVYKQPIGEGASNRVTLDYQEPYLDLTLGKLQSIYDYTYQWTVADDYVQQLGDRHQLRTGLRYDTINFVERQSAPIIPPDKDPNALSNTEVEALPHAYTDTTGNDKVYGAYLEDAWKALDPLTVSLGARYDRLQSTAEDHWGPRFGMTWRMDPETTWRIGYGQEFEFPGLYDLLPGIGNPRLTAPFARDYVLGLDRQLSDWLLGKLEVYHRDFFALVITDPLTFYNNLGSGRADGVEATFDLARWRGWTGSLAVTYSRSFRTSPQFGEVPYDYDQPWVVNLTAVAPTWNAWTASLRLRYSTGRPYTPAVGRVRNPDGSYSGVFGKTNSARFPDGLAWSARFERPAGLWGLAGTLYAEITQQHEVYGIDYGDQYQNLASPNYNYGIPAIPYLGYQLRF